MSQDKYKLTRASHPFSFQLQAQKALLGHRRVNAVLIELQTLSACFPPPAPTFWEDLAHLVVNWPGRGRKTQPTLFVCLFSSLCISCPPKSFPALLRKLKALVCPLPQTNFCCVTPGEK